MFQKYLKILNIKGVLLDKNQLENYLAKLASDNILKNKSDKKTYIFYRISLTEKKGKLIHELTAS